MSPQPDATVFVSGGRVMPGTKLNGVYEIEATLAPGGMGEVYKGHEIFSGKKVAIKFIRRELEENSDARQMFMNEGHSLGELHHEAIVRCFPLSVDPVLGRLYLPMEFVEGPSLFDLMQAGPLPYGQVRLLLKRIGAGLQAAHERRIFHRDVSPDNIIVPDKDVSRAKLIDFGIARSTQNGAVTVIGSGFAGKHNYVSPEQCGLFGGDVQAQSDIYSFGLVLAGVLLGRPLDMGGSLADVTAKRQKLPDLSLIDPAIRPVIAAMLRPDPATRPASMNAVIELLSPATVALPQPRPASRLSKRWAAGAAAAALAAGGAFWTLRPAPPLTEADLQARVRGFAAAFALAPCTLVTPDRVSASQADLTGLGPDPRAFEALVPAFQKRFGYAPTLSLAAVAAPQQCPALDFVKALAGDGAASVDLVLLSPAPPRRSLKSGRIVSGSITAAPEAAVALLRIDENGTVQDLTGSLRPSGTERSFQARLDRSPDGQPGAQPQLLLALSSPAPIALPPLPAAASTFFADLRTATGARPQLGMALSLFHLEK